MIDENLQEVVNSLKPKGVHILILQNTSEKETSSGFVLSSSSEEKKSSGIILAMGKLVDQEELKVGDNIVFDKYDVTEILVEDKNRKSYTLLIIKENSVWLVKDK